VAGDCGNYAVAKLMKKTKLKIGVPIKLDDSSLKSLPSPLPSKAQILEALVTLKIQNVTAARKTYDEETDRLEKTAEKLLNQDVLSLAAQMTFTVPGLWNNECQNLQLSLDSKHFSKITTRAIIAYNNHKNSAERPSIEGASCYWDETKVRNHVRAQLRAAIAEKEGTDKDRLSAMLADKTFRETMENTLAKIEGRAVLDA
jgi:hypothetical protein